MNYIYNRLHLNKWIIKHKKDGLKDTLSISPFVLFPDLPNYYHSQFKKNAIIETE